MGQMNRLRRLEKAAAGGNGEKRRMTPTEGIYAILRRHMALTHVIIPNADKLAEALSSAFEVSTMATVAEALRRQREEMSPPANDAEGGDDGDQG